ncbi:MAG: hypothetical protein Q8K79_09160 [Solirubrobacteraceae bacterium]|nr:hypothetical protein [Solirubrobacteraceae bacterium]
MSQTLSTILAAAEHAAGATSEESAAAEEHHKSEAPFFIAGAILVVFAIAISVVGFKKPDFPGSASAARGIMALSAALVLATVSTAVYVAI